MRETNMDRPRSALLLATVIGLLGSLLVLYATPATAHACSIAPPQLEVWPTSGLRPGDAVKVQGMGFHDAVWHDVPTAGSATDAAAVSPQRVAPTIAQPIDPTTCAGLELVPQVVVVSWLGPDEQPLQRVMGPDFELELRVPEWAQPGWAALSANGVLVEVKIGDDVPEPCPLAGDVVRPERWPDHCPKPCSEVLDASGLLAYPPCPEPCDVLVRPAIGVVDSGAAHWCPEPCPDYSRGDAAAQVLPPRCPDPCATDAATVAVWCPPPCPAATDLDPNQITEELWRSQWPHCPWPCEVPYDAHTGDARPVGGPCPPPPCPAVADLDQAQVTEEEWKRRWPHCPWPCDAAAGDAALSYWPCPPPPPCPAVNDVEPWQLEPEAWKKYWRQCPWPCDVLPLDDAVDAEPSRWPCPWPCPLPHPGLLDADARVWPCPDPCPWPYDLDSPPSNDEAPAIRCPYPQPVPEPEPCTIDPDGTGRCGETDLEPAIPVPAGSSIPAAGIEVGDDPSSSSIRAAASVDGVAPAPRIDFDGCRADGPSPCLDVVYDRAVRTLRRILAGIAR